MAIVGLAAMVISAPAFAELPESTPGNSISTGPGEAMSSRAQAPDTNGYSPAPSEDTSPHSSNPAFDVYNLQGEYVGSDPDPRIRSLLQDERRGREDD
jgi:hypothetical protein